MEKLDGAQKCSILGPQNLGSGGPGLLWPPWIRTWMPCNKLSVSRKCYLILPLTLATSSFVCINTK